MTPSNARRNYSKATILFKETKFLSCFSVILYLLFCLFFLPKCKCHPTSHYLLDWLQIFSLFSPAGLISCNKYFKQTNSCCFFSSLMKNLIGITASQLRIFTQLDIVYYLESVCKFKILTACYTRTFHNSHWLL